MAKQLSPERKVRAYIRTQKKGKLTFGDRITTKFSSQIKPINAPRSDYSLRNLVKFVLKAAYDRETYERGKFQCREGARRSAVDVWRLCKTYQPKVDIFSIMRELYALTVEKKIYDMDFCNDIEKRVFDLEDTPEGNQWGIEEEDEFGLMWQEWRSIGL